MAKYRKKPIVVEATQWFKNGDHPQKYEREGKVVRYFRNPEVDGESDCKHCGKKMKDHGWIDTLEGGHIVCPGDFIITGVQGECYPCKPDIFAESYQLVESNEVTSAAEMYASQIIILGSMEYKKVPPSRHDELMELWRLMNGGNRPENANKLNALQEAHGYLTGQYNKQMGK